MDEDSLREFDNKVALIKGRASFFMAKRRKDAELYQVIAESMRLCEIVTDKGLVEAVKQRVIDKGAKTKKRSYFEKESDVYLIVGRYVFEPEISREASWRYTATMREAARHGLTSETVVEWLSKNGGVNGLFRTRNKKSRNTKIKTLHLDRPVHFHEDRPFTVTLKRMPNGFFEVIHQTGKEQ